MDGLVLSIEDIDRSGRGQARPRQRVKRLGHQAAEKFGNRRQTLSVIQSRRHHPARFS